MTEAPMRSFAKGLPRQPKQHDHFMALAFAELPKMPSKIIERVSIGRLALEFLILTSARSGEVRGATWSEINLEHQLWSIPAARMNAGKAHIIPLSKAAIDVLTQAKIFRVPANELVFPGQKTKHPLSDMTLLKILRDMDAGVMVHGFRSTFRDWVAEETNFPGEIAEAALAHAVQNRVEAAYPRTDFLEKRKALMADWASFCYG
jgi:integrase